MDLDGTPVGDNAPERINARKQGNLLGPQSKSNLGLKTLVLDLEGTLIYTSDVKLENPIFEFI